MISPLDITIVIPVKDNQSGIDLYLKTFERVIPEGQWPHAIIIVDNNSSMPVSVNTNLPVSVISANEKSGPAYARNYAIPHVTTKWILFNDSDCVPTPYLMDGYIHTTTPVGCVAIQGGYVPLLTNPIAHYYKHTFNCSQERVEVESDGISPSGSYWQPLILVTCNALICVDTLRLLNGFDESFYLVASEDYELTLRLKKCGIIITNPNTYILHNFDDGVGGLVSRFARYTRGEYDVCALHKLQTPLPTNFSRIFSKCYQPIDAIFATLHLITENISGIMKGFKSTTLPEERKNDNQ